MARPKKETIDYFPHFVASGKTMFILESTFGNDGYAFWFKLLEIIGSTTGLYYDCSNAPEWRFLLAKTKVSEETASEILKTLAELDAIDKELWDEKIIWVQNLVNNVSDVYKRRNMEVPRKPSLCIQKPLSSEVSAYDNPQTKTKESKVNESKLKQITTSDDVNRNSLDDNEGNNPCAVVDYKDDVEDVISYYCEKAFILETNIKPTEIQTTMELLEIKRIPVPIIRRGIDEAFNKFKPAFDGDKIKSFNYCKPIIISLWEKEKVKEATNYGSSDGEALGDLGIGL